MKIGITCYPTYGGSGVVATELGIKMAALGHEVHFIAYALPYRLESFTTNLFFHEVDVLQYPLFEYPPYSLSLAHKMVDVVEHEKLDILHVHYAIPHATSAYLAREIMGSDSIKFITTLHGTDITLIGSDPSYLKIVKFSIEKSNGVTAVSRYLQEETYKTFQVENDIEVIHNFVPDRFWINNKELTRQRCFGQNNEIILTHISNFRAVKRVVDLVDVMDRLIPRFPVRLLMVGDGPERSRMQQLCREKGLCDHIQFLGKQQNVEQVLACSDLFLLPSEDESFGLAALEAMACGLPVVTTNAGGLPEVNIDGETGFTVDVGDTAAFADRIARIISDRPFYFRLARNARKRAYNEFNSEKIVPQYLNYYEKIITGG
ncbi:MAG TPA: N-acetyl-alpha-D-glucosaminyl L-malate synthase BshA [Caldithrix abyssi]|uniref:N-acetyl-alpha-D-glucosaminyl L-malate synthase BshA n=1 Tax=Caldithrix abyssi TaxID=187145 RepID=A0A7V5RN97_CALAY|nr:N-acetyl-alpha-D-glucosaminyl L-malate synthase BshA [Caldithrix abyssi]